MAIDSAAKRRSAAYAGYISLSPAPDGTISQADRQDAAWIYRGILATAFVVPDLIAYIMTVTEVSQPVMEIL